MKFELIYEGRSAELNELDFYDAAQAMVGFQRSIALTTHLVINGSIITQAPALKGARVIARAPEAGSYRIPAYILALSTGAYALGTAETDTPLGHLVYSAYDYAVQRTLGFNVDFEKSLGQQYEDLNESGDNSFPTLTEPQLESLSEKLEPALIEMHRPIIKSRTADVGLIKAFGTQEPFETPLNRETYDRLLRQDRDADISDFSAKISSYNINTFKGRAYLDQDKRPIPFQLEDTAQTASAVARITTSLRANAKNRFSEESEVILSGFANRSPTGRLKSISVVDVE
ncbi:hypothetical protein [Pseudooctadecabacter sp.]|uniref:DUF7946 domain-containing protein n=1 Tax=Pseudooctadecabacter sp. TaxID=1966338 RepID=UPI0035C7B8BF